MKIKIKIEMEEIFDWLDFEVKFATNAILKWYINDDSNVFYI